MKIKFHTLIFVSILVFKGADVFAQAKSSLITVAQDGSGQYTSVQAALNAIPKGNKKKVTVFIKNGIYYEKLHLDSSKNFVTIKGEDKFKTLLTYDDHTGKISR